jgi:hypothetical protein
VSTKWLHGLPKHLSPVEIEFEDPLGTRHRERLSELQIDLWGLGELIPIRYDPRALDAAEMTVPAFVGYFQSGLIIFFGLLTMSFAVLLRTRA